MTRPFTMEFDCNNASHGFMDCQLIIHTQQYPLEAHQAFPPFNALLGLVKALYTNNLPHPFQWQEETGAVGFHALPSAGEESNFRLQILREGEILVDANLDRQQTAASLLEALRNFALDCPVAGTHWAFPYFLIEHVERARANGFAPTAGSAAIANFVFDHFDDSGAWTFLPLVSNSHKQIHPSFSLWIDDDHAMPLRPGEGARLWRQWFNLLGRLERGELPGEVFFDTRKPQEECQDELDYLVQSPNYLLRAEPDADPDYFLLTGWRMETELHDGGVYFTVRVQRLQFTSAFMQAFRLFLHSDYLAYREGNPGGFDLHTLLK